MQLAANQQASLQGELLRLFKNAKLPTSPALATQVLQLAGDPKTGAEQFARLIQLDGALAARLLRMANTAHFAQREPVTTILRAVTVLGVGRIRTAALGFQLVGHLNKLGGCPFNIKTYWQHSLLRGCLAREIAKLAVPALKDEAFLVGLLQDCGILLLVQLLGADYAELYTSGGLSPMAFYSAEKERFRYNHVMAISAMAVEWGLPDMIAAPLARHHRPLLLDARATPVDRLSAVSYVVGSLCFRADLTVAASDTSLGEYAMSQLGVNGGDLRDCIRAAGTAYVGTAALLSDSLPEQLDVTDLLSEANRQLTLMAGQAEERASTVEHERDESRQQQENLKTALGAYRERASRDPLTGILNRGALVETTRQIINSAIDRGGAITVMFADIDNFKKFNDTFGHQAGDVVLQRVAAALQNALTNAGCAGRYGGEEFVVVIPGLTEDEARRKAHQIVDVVRRIDFADLQFTQSVTCSLGVVWAGPAQCTSAEDLFAAADALMYRAKRSGKDRYCFQALPANDDSPEEYAAAAPSAPTTVDRTDGQTPPRDPCPSRPSAVARNAARAVSKVFADPGIRQHAAALVPEQFRRIAEELNRQNPKRFVNMRKQERKELLTPCILTIFVGSSLQVSGENAYVRNISTGGIGLLATRPLMRGDPVEVTVMIQGKNQLYVAGLVAFCRHIEGPVHEIGIQFTAHGREPIFSRNPTAAIRNHAWLAQALRERRSRKSPIQYST